MFSDIPPLHLMQYIVHERHEKHEKSRSLCGKSQLQSTSMSLILKPAAPVVCLSAWDAAAVSRDKTDQKRKMFERSELFSFPVLSRLTAGTRRAASCGRLSLLTFFGEAKKVSGRRATPGLVAKPVYL